MSDKDLKVLGECIDICNGRRFKAGETFDPPPTEDQAKRLVLAGALPEGAIAIAKATDDLVAANAAVRAAAVAAGKAGSPEEKATAGKALTAAQAKAKEADADLAKLNK